MKKENNSIRFSCNDWCKSCGICAAFCVPKALEWEAGGKPRFLAEKCSGCNLCALRCPDFAIKLEMIKT